MDFEKMREGCPWIDDPDEESPTCVATGYDCMDYLCAPLHWIEELANDMYVSVNADLKSNSD